QALALQGNRHLPVGARWNDDLEVVEVRGGGDVQLRRLGGEGARLNEAGNVLGSAEGVVGGCCVVDVGRAGRPAAVDSADAGNVMRGERGVDRIVVGEQHGRAQGGVPQTEGVADLVGGDGEDVVVPHAVEVPGLIGVEGDVAGDRVVVDGRRHVRVGQ